MHFGRTWHLNNNVLIIDNLQLLKMSPVWHLKFYEEVHTSFFVYKPTLYSIFYALSDFWFLCLVYCKFLCIIYCLRQTAVLKRLRIKHILQIYYKYKYTTNKFWSIAPGQSVRKWKSRPDRYLSYKTLIQ